MVTGQSIRGRLAELLAAEAANDVTPAEREELERLLGTAPPAGRDQLMRSAGLAQVVFLHGDPRAGSRLPGNLRERLRRQGDAWQAGRHAADPGATPVADLDRARQRRDDGRRVASAAPATPAHIPAPAPARPAADRGARLGWYAAAAVLVLALALRLVPGATDGVADPAAQRAALLQAAPDLVQVAWGASREPGFERATGDVVWSSARQEGYLRLAGLPANDPARAQYQLWVVDPERDARPVDGGVFDVDGSGEVVIPVHAKLPVGRPSAFAITLEKSGGVVVSDGPMLLVAAVSG